jgi:hypothetical protein
MSRSSFKRQALALHIAAVLPFAAVAAPGASSPYKTDGQNTHVEDATSEGISQVNMITCFTTNMRPDALVNKGNYIALVDKNKCDPNARSDTSRSGSDSSSSNAPSYLSAVLNSTRASNSDPMRVKTWVDMSEKDMPVTIFLNTLATEAPSTSNPYGVFRIDYCGKGATGPCMMNGFLDGSASGISYYETGMDGGGDHGPMLHVTALRMTTSGADSGAGALQMTHGTQSVGYSFAYNASLFRRSDGTSDECFSRLADDAGTGMSVWRYGLYDANDGSRVSLMSGFSIEFSGSGDKSWHGQIGYYGLWVPPEASGVLTNGSTVQRVQYTNDGPPTKTPYTLVKAEGRLMKYTRQSRTLASADKIKFNAWVNDATGLFTGAENNHQYEMYWDNAAKVFKVTGVMDCGDHGCSTRDLDSEKTVAASFFVPQGGVRGFSQALGGELFIPLAGLGDSIDATAINVLYRVQDLVYPSQMPATLYCLRDCPTAGTISAYFTSGSTATSPFVDSTYNQWMPQAAGSQVTYTMDGSNAVMRDSTNAAVTFTDANALASRPQYQWGVRTGRLFTNLASAQCGGDASHLCEYKINELDVYYQWETGPNQWNQFAAVKDSTGAIVNFDAPLQVSWGVPSDSGKYGQYAGKNIMLQYGGFGDLWGIPGECVSRLTNQHVSCDTPESRYVPAFVIPFDETLGQLTRGSSAYLAKWLDREIRFARKDVSVCSAAGLTLPSNATLPDATGLKNPSDPASPIYIGEKPTVTDSPRVIDGEVKY